MRKSALAIALDLVLILIAVNNSSACTAFAINQGDSLVVVGKNYDWDVDDGLIIVNKRGVAKTAFGQANPAMWLSRFGSVTFNQYGREMPNGGMNEAGLVVEILWLRDSRYPTGDSRPAIGNLQWIQYQLDNCSSIDQVIASDTLIRIAPDFGVNVHYFVCDSLGHSAVIEFLDGKMKSSAHNNLPVAAITNNTYEQSLNYLKKYEDFGGQQPMLERDNSADVYSGVASLDRFAHATKCIKEYDPEHTGNLIEYAFGALNKTRSGDRTQWSIVYDIPSRKIYCKTMKAAKIKEIDMKKFDYSCRSAVKVLDINSPKSSNVNSAFKTYNFEINSDLIRRSFSKTGFLNNIPAVFFEQLAGYPENLTCLE